MGRAAGFIDFGVVDYYCLGTGYYGTLLLSDAAPLALLVALRDFWGLGC